MGTKTAQAFTPEERRQYLGASEIAAVLGVDRYRTPLDVYNEKLGLAPAFEGNKHTERGNRLESVAAEEYSRHTGYKLRRRNEELVHADHPFIRGHVDRVVVGEQRIVEIKCPSGMAYRRMIREGLPESYILQAQVYMGLTNCNTLTYAIFCADQWDLATFDLEFDETLYDAVIGRAAAFWQDHVLARVPPTTDKKRDAVALEFSPVSGEVTFRDDEAFLEWAAKYREAYEISKDAETLVKQLKEEGIALIGDAPGKYEGGGVRIAFTPTKGRISFDKDALKTDHPEIDLSKYEKTGAPSMVFRTYLVGGE